MLRSRESIKRVPSFLLAGRYFGVLAYFLPLFVGLFLGFGAYWLLFEFGNVNLDQVLFSLVIAPSGLADGDMEIFWSGTRWVVLYPLLLSTPLAFLLERILGRIKRRAVRHIIKFTISTGVLFAGFTFAAWVLDLRSYVRSAWGEDYFGRSRVDASDVVVSPVKPKNLLMIYVESLEANFGRADIFGRDLLAPLREIEKEGVSFSRFETVAPAAWTIGAQVATQCGVPLRVIWSGVDGNMQGEKVRRFLPSAKCLGDILSAHGYRNVFLQGASFQFAGQGRFWRDHGYRFIGREDFAKTKTRMGKWGAHDDHVMRVGIETLGKLHRGGSPFNLTMVLLDTHFPRGLLSKTCQRRGFSGLDGIIECTAGLIAEFILRAEKQGFLENTAIVIMGDHPMMQSTLTDRLERTGPRLVYNLFLRGAHTMPNRQDMIHFDVFPTVLRHIGFDVPGGRMELGYAAFGDLSDQPAETRISDINEKWNNPSPAYMALWM